MLFIQILWGLKNDVQIMPGCINCYEKMRHKDTTGAEERTNGCNGVGC